MKLKKSVMLKWQHNLLKRNSETRTARTIMQEYQGVTDSLKEMKTDLV